MAKGIQKIISLINKTGDKCIILDNQGEPAYVVMKLDDYEDLAQNSGNIKDLTEDELLAKINQDIANWKASQEAEDNWQSLETVIQGAKERIIDSKIGENSLNQAKTKETDDQYYFEPIE